MKKFENFTNLYSIKKTLRFSLIPIGKTEENFNNALLLDKDKARAQKYNRVKGYIDRYHKHFINEKLYVLRLDSIKDYAELYFKVSKTEKDINLMTSMEDKLRKSIANVFKKDNRYKALFKREMIEEILPSFLTSAEELSDVESFFGFTTYFEGFHKNRENIYSDKEQTTAISYRCINENLPKFLDNVMKFDIANAVLPKNTITELNDLVYDNIGFRIQDIFSVDYYNFALSQTGIDAYNNILGGYIDNDGNKIKGINEYINLYNQQVAGKDKSKRLPLFTSLYKQILSDRDKISFIPEKFTNDDEVLTSLSNFYENILHGCMRDISNLFNDITSYNFDGIFLSTDSAKSEISNAVFGRWDAIREGWSSEYRSLVPQKPGKNSEKYEEDMNKAYKNHAFSLAETQKYGDMFKTDNCIGDIAEYLRNDIFQKIEAINDKYASAKSLLTSNYAENNTKELLKNSEAKELLKNLLDSVKDLEHSLKRLKGTGKEENKDFIFYGSFTEYYETLTEIDTLYDKVRNYLTRKPYSNDKIKLNFENGHFMEGWALGQELSNSAQLFKLGDNEYYLGIIEKTCNSILKNGYQPPAEDSDTIYKVCYEQIPNPGRNIPNLMFVDGEIRKINGRKDSDGVNRTLEKAKNDNLPCDVNNIRLRNGYKVDSENSTTDEIRKFIEYYMNATKAYYSKYDFKFKNASDYKSFAEFVEDTDRQSYQINYLEISKKQLIDYADKGYIYLFRIYNKDFSPHSHGKPNLHTMYFKMLFDEKNLANVVYQLNGGAEMFYREASIKDNDRVIHYANQPLKNKNEDNPKRYSTFEYDIIKDKRYTKRQFSLHLPITLNAKAGDSYYLNNDVRLALKESEDNYIIGIDRGERNLLYICVIDGKGNIVEQKSLNEIISDNNYKVNYHKLLDNKEDARDKARKNWDTIENIKELKEGYLSQVVHQICEYVVKYDAIIAMEDLNFGFKNGRFKVEKQVYQKFENMLTEKLNYLVRKDETPENPGGLLKAYQLTNKTDKINKARQNGIIFYVPAWLTSKIDPVTGFADLLKPRYISIKSSLDFIAKIDDIRFNQADDMFEFDIDYSKFPNASLSYKKQWTICTNSERIINVRNVDKNNAWDNKIITLTDEFKKLFEAYGVDYSENIKESILKITTGDFHKRFMKLLSYTLQMRNSIVNDVDVDYLISCVRDENGRFYDSRNHDNTLPNNADANGAYNIARKALWAISVLKDTDSELLKDASIYIKKSDWLKYTQK